MASENKNTSDIIYDYVVSHKNCNDGNCAKWIAKTYGPVNLDTVYISIPAGNPFDLIGYDITDSNILFLDVVATNLLEIAPKAANIIILDHHITNFETFTNLPSNVIFTFDDKKCGTELAWDEFCSGKKYPWFVNAIADRDLWRWAYPNSKELCKSVLSDLHRNDYSELLDWTPEQIAEDIQRGQKIINEEQKLINRMVTKAIPASLVMLETSYTCLITTGPMWLASDVGNLLSKKAQIGVIYTYNLKEDEWLISLRSSGENAPSVSTIAQSFGGGGHARASGFTIKGPKNLRSVFII